MSAVSNRQIAINTTGDAIVNNIYEAAENLVAPNSVTIHELVAGANTITVPVATGVVVKAATIIPPADNDQTMILKGVTGDTGVGLHLTDPTSIGLAPTVLSFVITAGGTISGLRVVWT